MEKFIGLQRVSCEGETTKLLTWFFQCLRLSKLMISCDLSFNQGQPIRSKAYSIFCLLPIHWLVDFWACSLWYFRFKSLLQSYCPDFSSVWDLTSWWYHLTFPSTKDSQSKVRHTVSSVFFLSTDWLTSEHAHCDTLGSRVCYKVTDLIFPVSET